MSNVRRMVGTLLAAVVAAVVFWASGQTEEQGPVSAPGEVAVSEQSADVAALLDEIPTRPETGHRTYDREEWRHWITVTGDPRWRAWVGDRTGCNTREAVLIRDGWKVRTGEGCRITDGTWRTSYDNRRHTSPESIDIDHLVPLAEAHQSGAANWPAEKKERFANDPRNVLAASGTLNRAKGDKDLAEWLPERNRCTYVSEWVSIKKEYGLAMDAREKDTARRILSSPACWKDQPN